MIDGVQGTDVGIQHSRGLVAAEGRRTWSGTSRGVRHLPTPRMLHLTNSAVGGGIQEMVSALAGDGVRAGLDVRVLFWRAGYPRQSVAPYLRLESRGHLRDWPRALFRYLRAFQPDLVHLHGPVAGSIGAAIARAAGGYRILYTDHNPHWSRPAISRLPRRWAARVPDMNVAISREVGRSLVEDCRVPASRVRIILNGTPVVPRLSRPEGELRRFVYVAELAERKAHDTLLLAFAATDPSCRLVLVGEGPLRARLESLSRQLGLSDRVEFLGWLDDPWVVANGAWAYVHPARIEGGGIAVMEAMMRGLPVIVTATGGLLDIVRDGDTGFMVAVDDVEALSGSLRRITNSWRDRLTLANRARAYAERNLSIDRTLESYMALYRELLGPDISWPNKEEGE